ncbi:hypothetical protein BFW38_13530 [Terasakiispira papahanaumokuakeensis]|uniref:EamA domain-containing protein n=1 Tax=Terasakiispira papahanaumokuakeensis TaxID=197479 RepID=A0A1E2VBL6_9GAMM|nr:EamA family transporter [Terasakiispira papahanaumokuakeensis]ODC04400.1 hypothetical protein BFW38_13530 [Terasakiispira papahanaumokuakeensis]
MSARSFPLWPIGLLLIAMMSIQSGAALAKQLFPLIGANGVTMLRLIMAAIMLWLVLRPWRQMPTRAQWPALLVYGITLGLMNYLFYLSIARIPLGIAVALEFSGPLVVALWNSRRLLDVVWVALALIGILLLMPQEGLRHSLDLTGVLLALGAGACWASYIIFGQKVGTGLGPNGTAFGVLAAALVIAPLCISQGALESIEPSVLPWAALVGLLSTALPYSLEMVALKHLPTTTFGTLLSLEPAIAALSGLMFLGETLTMLQWLAMFAIMLASVGTTLNPTKATSEAAKSS